MTHLIKRFREDLQLAGYAKRSTDSYVSSVLRLQRFLNKPLEDITEEQLRQYWLCCQNEFGWSAASLRISYAGIQHFFKRTLVRPWDIFNNITFKTTLNPINLSPINRGFLNLGLVPSSRSSTRN